MKCPFKVGDRIRKSKSNLEPIVTVIEGECYEQGFDCYEKVD